MSFYLFSSSLYFVCWHAEDFFFLVREGSTARKIFLPMTGTEGYLLAIYLGLARSEM